MQRFLVPLAGMLLGVVVFFLLAHLVQDHLWDDTMRQIQRQQLQQIQQQQQQAK